MKKFTFILLFVVSIGPGVFFAAAQETEEWKQFPYALGAGVEMNMNTREGWGQGFVAAIDRHLFDKHLLVGIRGGMGTDYHGISSTEGGLYVRLYPYKLGLGGAFTQFGWGLTSFQEDNNNPITALFDFSTGFRFFFLKGFYAEAYVRTGYPMQWGFGALGGHRFNF
jgi:hypothetical protein